VAKYRIHSGHNGLSAHETNYSFGIPRSGRPKQSSDSLTLKEIAIVKHIPIFESFINWVLIGFVIVLATVELVLVTIICMLWQRLFGAFVFKFNAIFNVIIIVFAATVICTMWEWLFCLIVMFNAKFSCSIVILAIVSVMQTNFDFLLDFLEVFEVGCAFMYGQVFCIDNH
jgi:hypothetical protein